MTKTPMYTAEIFGTQGQLPAMEQICYYNAEDTQYELRFLDLLDYPGIVGDEPTMLVNDGDLIVTIPFLVLDTVSEGDQFTFSLIEGTVCGTTAVGLNDVPGTGDSATVVIPGGDTTSEDTTVETLAKYGNGTYAYVDSLAEAKKVLVDDFNKTMITVAKDVKNKVAFNPNLVSEYRLIGYENKSITKEEFEDVNADAGDLGSGHETLVTYEVKLKDNYQTINEELFKLQINYKDPKTLTPKTFIYNGTKAELAEKDTEDHEFVKCIVEFSLILRNSPYRGTADYANLVTRLAALKCIKNDSLKLQFYLLVCTAFQDNLVAPPAYQNNQQSNGFIVTIYTQFGSVQARYNYNAFINYNSIMQNVFGKVPTSTTFKMYLDPNYSCEFKEGLVVSDMDIYLIELK